MGDHPATRPVTPPNSTPCRELLGAIRAALDIPYPQTVADERGYYILRSKRASLAGEACDRILNDPGAGSDDMHDAAGTLTGQLTDYPPDTYRHSGLPR
jgi:hypothetical protein